MFKQDILGLPLSYWAVCLRQHVSRVVVVRVWVGLGCFFWGGGLGGCGVCDGVCFFYFLFVGYCL